MMSESKSREEFAKNLVAQDPPLTDEQLRRNETLFKKIERRMRLVKAVIIAIYMVLYLVAFGALMLGNSTDNVTHSICWGAVSLHIMLWSFVYVLRGICMNMEELIEKKFDNDEKRRHKNQNLFLTILAIMMFVFSSIILYRSFFLVDSLRVAQKAIGILWTTIFFLTYYPFRTASLIGKLWFEYKKMELNITKPEQPSSKNQDE
jgi:hypothetical protein